MNVSLHKLDLNDSNEPVSIKSIGKLFQSRIVCGKNQSNDVMQSMLVMGWLLCRDEIWGNF